MEPFGQPYVNQDDIIERPKLRRRPPLSCLSCKRRKIRCDRLMPCNQCKKLTRDNKAALCAYAGAPASSRIPPEDMETETNSSRASLSDAFEASPNSSIFHHPEPLTPLDDIVDLRQRLENIEHLLAIPSSASPSRVASKSTIVGPTLLREGRLYLNNGRLCYAGPGHYYSLMSRFEEIQAWMEKSRKDAALKSMENQFRSYQEVFTRGQQCPTAQFVINGSTLEADMLGVLALNLSWKRLADLYWEYFEHHYRILHKSTFFRTLNNFTSCPEEMRAESFPRFIPQLLLILLLGSSLDDSDSFVQEIAASIPAPQCIIDIVEAWLERQPWKARTELSYFRTQCLLLLAQQIHQAPKQKLANYSGSLVRSAMLAGLHQDPGHFQSMSIFQGEMRRKLWATIVELDLQVSTFCGCPSMARKGNYNVQVPSNMDDLELVEDMEQLTPHPTHVFTQASCQIALARSLPSRLEALELTQNINTDRDYSQALKLGKRIELFIDQLPACLQLSKSQSNKDLGRTFNLIMLNTYLRGTLQALYLPFSNYSSRIPTPITVFSEAATTHHASSVYLLSNLDFFRAAPSSPDDLCTTILKARLSTLYHRLCNMAFTKAVLIIGLQVRASPSSYNNDYLISLISSTLNHQLSLLPTPDGNLRHTLLTSLVLAYVSAPPAVSVEEREIRMRDAADLVLAECLKQLGPIPEDIMPVEQQYGPQVVSNDDFATDITTAYDCGAEFMGAEGVNFGSALDWDTGLSWI